MDVNSIPDIFQSKLRIAIVSCLMTGVKTFSEIKEITGATDGNLSTHLSKLEEAGYTIVHRGFLNKKPRTSYEITAKGETDFKSYVLFLEGILRQNAELKK